MAYFWIGAACIPIVLGCAALVVHLAFNELEEVDSLY